MKIFRFPLFAHVFDARTLDVLVGRRSSETISLRREMLRIDGVIFLARRQFSKSPRSFQVKNNKPWIDRVDPGFLIRYQ